MPGVVQYAHLHLPGPASTACLPSVILEFNSQLQHYMHARNPVSSREDSKLQLVYVNFTLWSNPLFWLYASPMLEGYSEKTQNQSLLSELSTTIVSNLSMSV